jgi:hypothetical protein
MVFAFDTKIAEPTSARLDIGLMGSEIAQKVLPLALSQYVLPRGIRVQPLQLNEIHFSNYLVSKNIYNVPISGPDTSIPQFEKPKIIRGGPAFAASIIMLSPPHDLRDLWS